MSPLTGVINESWQLYKAHARHLITIAFVVFLPMAVVTVIVALAGGIFARLLADLVLLIGFYVLEAALVKAVQDVRDGTEDLSVGQTFSAVIPRIGSVLVASIIASILIEVGFFIVIIPGIILATIWCLIVPVIVVENGDALGSFGRSQRLVRGHFWNVLGTLILVFLILFVVEIILGLIFTFLPTVLGLGLAVLIAGSVIAPFGAAVITLMYFRLAAAPVPAAGGYGGPNPYGDPNPFSGPPPSQSPFGGPPPSQSPFGGPPPGQFGTQPPGQFGTGYPPSGQPDSGFPPDSGGIPPSS
jgi:hypothetical protein